MLTVITDRKQVDSAQKEFVKAMRSVLKNQTERTIGYKGGNRDEIVYYDDAFGLWLTTSTDVEGTPRYWNPLGLQNISQNKTLSISIEINIPFSPNRRIAGIFLRDSENSNIYVGHRGGIGGSKKGVGKTAFMKDYSGKRVTVNDGDRTTEILLISALNSPDLVANVKKFVLEVAAFKNSV